MSLEDKLPSIPDCESRQRQDGEEHTRRLNAISDALSELGERVKRDLEQGPAGGVPASHATFEALQRLKLHQELLAGLLGRVTGRYVPQGADAYAWPAEGLHFNYHPLTLDELAKDSYPGGKLMEGVVHFRADTGNGPLRYRAAYCAKGIFLESEDHAEFGDFVHVLTDLKEYHGISEHENLYGGADGIHAELPLPLPTTRQFLEHLTRHYAVHPFEILGLRAIYEGITREEFERATLPREKIVKSW